MKIYGLRYGFRCGYCRIYPKKDDIDFHEVHYAC
jgi:hypothetical protein